MSYNTHTATFDGRTVKLLMPEITHYGYDGSGSTYAKADRAYTRQLVIAAKKEFGLTNKRCVTEVCGDTVYIYPRGADTDVLIIDGANA